MAEGSWIEYTMIEVESSTQQMAERSWARYTIPEVETRIQHMLDIDAYYLSHMDSSESYKAVILHTIFLDISFWKDLGYVKNCTVFSMK